MRQQDISLIEVGRLQPTIDQLHRLARIFGVPTAKAELLLSEVPDPLRPIVEPESHETVVA